MAVHRRRRGGTPPPFQTEVTIVGKHEIYPRENLIGPLLVHKVLGPRPPPPPFVILPMGCQPSIFNYFGSGGMRKP